MWGAAGEVKALRSAIKRVAACELEISAGEAADAALYWEDMVLLLPATCVTPALQTSLS